MPASTDRRFGDGARPVTSPIIDVEDLVKVYQQVERREGFLGSLQDLFDRRYNDVRAVDGVSFTIDPGEMVGYIGANGAGKSTTVKMLTGILTPTSGKATVNGLVPWESRYRHTRQIGVVFGQRTQLWWDLAVIEAFKLLADIYKVEDDAFENRLDQFVEVLGIGDLLHTQVRKLSLGQRMKCDLAASLLHNPPVVFLDEPTIGLDVAVKESIRKFIRKINQQENTTFILTTHDLQDIEALCPRIVILDRGRIIYDGDQDGLHSRFAKHRKVIVELKAGSVRVAEEDEGDMTLEQAETRMVNLFDVDDIEVEHRAGSSFELIFNRNQLSAGEVLEALLGNFQVKDLELHEPDLEQIIREIYEGTSKTKAQRENEKLEEDHARTASS